MNGSYEISAQMCLGPSQVAQSETPFHTIACNVTSVSTIFIENDGTLYVTEHFDPSHPIQCCTSFSQRTTTLKRGAGCPVYF